MEPLHAVGRSALYASDIVDFLSSYDERPFDITVTSPPYGLEKAYEGISDSWVRADYFDWVEYWAGLLYNQTAKNGRLCVNVPFDINLGGHVSFANETLSSLLAAGWEYQTTIVWDKGVINNRTAYGSWMSASAPNIMMPTEAILVLYRDDWVRGKAGRTTDISREDFLEWRTSIWRVPGESAKRIGHPAPFPPEIPERLLRLLSFKEDLVFDPFVGSGTTAEVCERLERDFVGVDQSAEYLTELCLPRIERVGLTARQAELAS